MDIGKLRIGILILLALIAWAVMSSGCYTENKATKQVNKAFDKYPGVVAKKAAKEFPCVIDGITYDSSGYYKMLDSIHNLITWYDSTINEIGLPEQIHDTLLCVANLGILKRNADRYEAKIGLLNKEIARLYDLTKSPAVIVDTIRIKDSAEAVYLSTQLAKEKLQSAKDAQKIEDLTTSNNKWKLWFFLLLSANIAIAAIKIYLKFKA